MSRSALPSSSPALAPGSVGTTGLAGLAVGAIAALAGAGLDVARATDLHRYTGDEALPFFAFLSCLYAVLFVPIAGAAAAGLTMLARLPLVRRWLGDPQTNAPSPARWQLGLAGLVAAGLCAALLRPLFWVALQRFHHRGLLSLLLVTYSLALGAAACLLLLLALHAARREPSEAPPPPDAAAGPLSIWLLAVSCALGTFLLLAVRIASQIQEQTRWPLPQRTTALAVALPMLGALILGLASALGSWLRRRLALHAIGKSSRTDGWLLRGLCGALPLLACGLWLLRSQAEALRILDLRPIHTVLFAMLVAASLLFFGSRLGFLRRASSQTHSSLRWLSLILLGLPIFAWLGALQLGSRESLRKAGLSLAPLCERIIQTQALLLDWDGDGSAGRLSIGGSDCNDFDASRHPGAFDWPDNGIDENCNGHDATTRPGTAARPLVLPDGLPQQPNIVLITVDALRSDHVSTYGYARATTPQLDALAADRDSVVFDSAWAHAPSTRYSVPAILTGRYPSTIAWGSPQVHWPPQVLPQNRLLSEMLADRGYSTTALLSYHYFEPAWGLSRGFADYDTHLMVLHSLGGDPAATSGSSSRELADLALAKLPTLLSSGKPFFLWVHFYDPHFRYDRHPLPPGDVPFGEGEQDLYDEEIRYTDRHIGRLLDALRQSPAWPRTSLLVTADHGEGFGEHGIPPDRRHGYHLYANQTRVPFILRLAGLRQAFPSVPRRIAAPVAHVDIVPTLLHSVLRQPPHAVERQLLGQSLLPLLAQPQAEPEHRVFQEVMYEGPTVRKALVTDRWHLIQNLIPDGTIELYDLKNDPQETRDLAGRRQTEVEQRALQDLLSAWMDDSAIPVDFDRRIASLVTESPPSVRTPLQARIGDCLDVLGADQSTDAVQPGQSMQVTVVYRLRCRIPAGYRLFFHLRSPVGPFVNADHEFLDGIVPAQNLPIGRYIRDVTTITLPPAFPGGQAALHVGLFQRNVRLPVSGPASQALTTDRSVVVGHVQVGSP